MARIELLDVGHAYAAHDGRSSNAEPDRPLSWALKPMTMTWSDGGAYALLGPSGCGKTTLLNIISGLITPTRGRIRFDDVDVTSTAPEARNIAQVFQFPVVYDTMTVFDNLAFPLRNRRWSEVDVRRRVHEIAEILELMGELPRRARALSADQKQKISLGRGLVRPDVAAVLFDEPLTVIDPHLKWLLRRKLKQIHQQLRLSLIYVTHDQTEALTFADQVVVMTQGEVVQVGSPEALFEAPAHRFVGHFIGSPGMNFLPCEWADGAARVGTTILHTQSRQAPPPAAKLLLGVRPEYVGIANGPAPNCAPGAVIALRDQGVHWMVQIEVSGTPLWAKLRSLEAPPKLGPTFVHIPPARCSLYADDVRLS